MFGGGLFSSIVKRNKTAMAKETLEEMKDSIRNLNSELSDISEVLDYQIYEDDFLKFTDIFLDNIIVDMSVQSEIKNTLTELKNLEEKLSSIRADLVNKKK